MTEIEQIQGLYEYLSGNGAAFEPPVGDCENGPFPDDCVQVTDTPKSVWKCASGMIRMANKGLDPNLPHPDDPVDYFIF